MSKDNCSSYDCNCINDVTCGVKNCMHHTTDNRCSAERITVKNESAERMAETFCGTFSPRTSC